MQLTHGLEALFAADRTETGAQPAGREPIVILGGRGALFRLLPLAGAARRTRAGDCVAYAVGLDGPVSVRLVTVATLRLRLWLVERAMTRNGAMLVGRYGIDPNLSAPACVYELNSAAASYAERGLRPPV